MNLSDRIKAPVDTLILTLRLILLGMALSLIGLLLAGCGAHKPVQTVWITPAIWIDAAREPDAELNAEFATGHWSCPTGYQFLGKRWDMGVHTASATCWRHQ